MMVIPLQEKRGGGVMARMVEIIARLLRIQIVNTGFNHFPLKGEGNQHINISKKGINEKNNPLHMLSVPSLRALTSPAPEPYCP
jgi:hypothetical protein